MSEVLESRARDSVDEVLASADGLILTVGSVIKELRRSSGLSARSLSLMAGLSASYVGKIEKGEVMPSLEAFGPIVRVLGLSAREIKMLVTEMPVRQRPQALEDIPDVAETAEAVTDG